MDRFFNSKELAAYVKETGCPLTIRDAAWIIDRSEQTTLDEKIAAWQELIETLPDCAVDERLQRVQIDTFHQFLQAYIRVKKKLREAFYEAVDAVYTYHLSDPGWEEQDASKQDWFSVEDKRCFPDPGNCLDHYRTYAQVYAGEHVRTVGFAKHVLPNGKGKYQMDAHISLEMTPDLRVINIRDHGTLTGKELIVESAFTLMEKPSLPVPYKNGDILTDPTMKRLGFSYPFVLEKDGGKEEVTTNEECRFVHVSGDEETPHLVGLWDSLSADVEKAREPLKGRYRMLKPLSSSVRTDPETGKRMLDTELTLSAFHLLLREEMNQAELEKLKKEYTKEELEAAGVEG